MIAIHLNIPSGIADYFHKRMANRAKNKNGFGVQRYGAFFGWTKEIYAFHICLCRDMVGKES